MSKPYWSGQGGRTGGSDVDDRYRADGYTDDRADDPTRRVSGYDSSAYNSGFYSNGGYRSTDEYRSTVDDQYDDEYADDEYADYEYYERDLRWRWVAGLAVAVLIVAVIAITMVMRGDSPSPTAASETPATSTTPRTVIATIPPSPAEPPPPQLSPETVVTITTTPSAVIPPLPVEAAPPPAPVEPPAAAAAPGTRTVTYTVTGTRQLIDLVSIIYTDEQGLPRTDVNVTLPWNKTVVLNPDVNYESVTATSVTSQLNCAITDAAGATLIAQNNNSMITTCTG